MLERFSSELEVENYIREVIDVHITRTNPHIYALKNKKAVDILICRDGAQPALFFIEVKYHQLSHGRLGFGGKEGGGFQPEIVKGESTYFEQNLRWVLASDRHVGKGVLFLPSSVIRKHLAGGAVGEKFNNIRERIFHEIPFLHERQLVSALQAWFGVASKNSPRVAARASAVPGQSPPAREREG